MVELGTDRLLLRPWRPEDREPFAALNADPEVMECLPALLTRAESDALADRIDAAFRHRGYGLWAIEVRDGEPFVGFTGLNVRPDDGPAPGVEVGWRLARNAWGFGYATEAARAALAYAFDRARLPEVVSLTARANLRSQAVMQRIGLRLHAEFDYPGLPEGSPLRPHVLYGIDARTYAGRTSPVPSRTAGTSGPTTAGAAGSSGPDTLGR